MLSQSQPFINPINQQEIGLTDLPNEIKLQILQHLSPLQLAILSHVCKNFRALAADSKFGLAKIQETFFNTKFRNISYRIRAAIEKYIGALWESDRGYSDREERRINRLKEQNTNLEKIRQMILSLPPPLVPNLNPFFMHAVLYNYYNNHEIYKNNEELLNEFTKSGRKMLILLLELGVSRVTPWETYSPDELFQKTALGYVNDHKIAHPEIHTIFEQYHQFNQRECGYFRQQT